MTETSEATAAAAADARSAASRKKAGGLNSMLLPELKALAGTLGIKGTTGMRKSALVEAIGNQTGSPATSTSSSVGAAPAVAESKNRVSPSTSATGSDATGPSTVSSRSPSGRDSFAGDSEPPANAEVANAASVESSAPDSGTAQNRDSGQSRQNRDGGQSRQSRDRSQGRDRNQSRESGDVSDQRDGRDNVSSGDSQNRESTPSRDGNSNSQSRDSRDSYRDDDRGSSRNSRRRNRNRDRDRDRDRDRYRDRTGRREGNEPEPQVSDDDVLVPVAGILDLLDSYAFVRTSGYLPGPGDVYVALSMVRKFNLRKGDAITGAVKQKNDGGGGGGDKREKYNPIVRIDTVNGTAPEEAKARPDFSKLTPLYAADRLRLETEANLLTTRLIDIVAPIGKGQRGLIVSPSKAGKTLVMQAIANAITTNNPECHLMVVLVDERPEEVTEMQRAVKGEVIASTFDRPAEDHTTVAELAIERAKRLVELGHDVVVLLDSITRLGRAYNLAAPASGRILSGGVDSSALYPPKKFFGAARNIEDGGSLTILATALIETGSKMDEVIFEEFKGTGNMELRLRREFADRRIFPAIDVVASGTRREELLMSKDELQIVWKLRRVLSGLDGQQALELLINKLKSTKSNMEFLMQVNKTTPTISGTRESDDD
ncbi:MAG: transcription termination factor Rho [Nocardioidaceae bacterium]|nr:transcription termination factor Rho [Nocardioidaceae bacterium]